MVDVTFQARAGHFIPLSLVKRIATLSPADPPDELAYIGKDGVDAVKNMALVKQGRLSVQPIAEDAWRTIQLLAKNGGWEEEGEKKKDTSPSTSTNKRKRSKASGGRTKSTT